MSDLFGHEPGMIIQPLPPGVKPRHGMPYAWVTWLTPMLSGEAICPLEPWMKVHYKFESERSNGGVSAEWKMEHDALVQQTVKEFDGAHVTIEDQNKFTLEGKTILIAGKPDIIVYEPLSGMIRVIDRKGGEEKASHWWQLWIYLYAMPRVGRVLPDRLVGEIRYRTKTVTILPTEVAGEPLVKLTALCRQLTSNARPAAVPSPKGCLFCDVPKSLCPERDDSGEGMTGTTEDF